jgi:hypothetical protein
MRAQTETQTSTPSVLALPYILVFVISVGKCLGNSFHVASWQSKWEIKCMLQYLPLVGTGL